MPRITLIFHNEAYSSERLAADANRQLFEEFVTWIDSLEARGLYDGSDALAPNSTANTVRRRGEAVAIDGPFAETHEAINGFVTVLVADRAAALALAAECPGLKYGMAVEVRELLDVIKPGR